MNTSQFKWIKGNHYGLNYVKNIGYSSSFRSNDGTFFYNFYDEKIRNKLH
jgi:hypothetical protein